MQLRCLAILNLFAVLATTRLPSTMVPLSYRLSILLRITQPYQPFEGTVAIFLYSSLATKTILMNAQNLVIYQGDRKGKRILLKVYGKNETIAITLADLNSNTGRLTLHLATKMKAHTNYTLRISFSSVLRNDNTGIYSSSYVDHNTTLTQWLAATQFDPIYARQAFPCFDDPMFRTPFTIILGHPAQFRALSNMPANKTIRNTHLKRYVWTIFRRTPPIPTHLVAFSVSKFDTPGAIDKQHVGCPISTWARPDARMQTEYATQTAPLLLAFYEELFALHLTHYKIDQLALPDSSMWAIGNMGIHMFTEAAILFDSARNSLADQQGVARSVAISLVHQWFGNLVSVPWWNERWLKNAFALYLSSFGVDTMNPDWEYLERHGLQLYFDVLDIDAYVHSDLVRSVVVDESQMWGTQDEVNTRKGTVLLNMLHHMVGEEVWIGGIRRYLKLYANSSATAQNFWDVLQLRVDRDGRLAKGLNITRVMDSWLSQRGYPLLTVTRDYRTRSALVEQERFLIRKTEDQFQSVCWWIPLTYTCASCKDFNSTIPRHWLTCPTNDNKAPKVRMRDVVEGPRDWLLLNIRHSSPLRVNYDLRNWQLLNKTLSNPQTFRSIHRINRAQLVDDILHFAWSGVMDYPMALGMLSFLQHEDEYVVWEATVSNFERINRVAKKYPTYLIFKKYMRVLLKRQFDELSENPTVIAGKLNHRPVILELACQYELPACLNLSRMEFGKRRKERGWMTIRERETIFCMAVRFGTEADWTVVDSMYHRSNVAAEQESLLTALACSRNIFSLERVLKRTFETAGIRIQNVKRAFLAVVSNPIGYRIATTYVQQNIASIKNLCNNSTNKVVQLLTPLLESVTTEVEIQFFEKFFAESLGDMVGIERFTRQLLELGNNNIHWHRTKYDAMLKAMGDISLWKDHE
ncbi:hypothetical protein KR018_012517 [Drosophila ironensis]|nr:hypothetical protein KR018_012517 [Drosophila ironensis]